MSGFAGVACEVESAARRLVIVVGKGCGAVGSGKVDTEGGIDGAIEGHVKDEDSGAAIPLRLTDAGDAEAGGIIVDDGANPLAIRDEGAVRRIAEIDEEALVEFYK